jgi:hypothetical protein
MNAHELAPSSVNDVQAGGREDGLELRDGFVADEGAFHTLHPVRQAALRPFVLAVLVVAEKLEASACCVEWPEESRELLRIGRGVVETADQRDADQHVRMLGQRLAQVALDDFDADAGGCTQARIVVVLEVDDEAVDEREQFAQSPVRAVRLDRRCGCLLPSGAARGASPPRTGR